MTKYQLIVLDPKDLKESVVIITWGTIVDYLKNAGALPPMLLKHKRPAIGAYRIHNTLITVVNQLTRDFRKQHPDIKELDSYAWVMTASQAAEWVQYVKVEFKSVLRGLMTLAETDPLKKWAIED